MNLKSTLTLTALTAPALAALLAPADKLAFHPAAGAKLTRQWEVKSEISLDEQNMTLDGKPMPVDIDMDMEMSSQLELTISDKLVELDGGQPKQLRRTFDKLSSNGSFAIQMAMMPDGGMEKSMTGSSGLEGKTVQFTWNPDDKHYDKAFYESEGEAKLLEHLDEDLDLRGLLPEKEVAAGDTWSVDANVFKHVLQPGGDLGIRPNLDKEEQDQMGMMGMGMDNFGDMSRMVGDSIEGDVKAEYKGSHEAEGVTVGEVHLTFKINSSNDATEMTKKMFSKMPEGVEFEIDHIDVDFTYEGEATLLWDIAGGHVHSLEVSGEISTKQDSGMTVSTQGKKMNIATNSTLSGSMNHHVTISKG